MKHSTIIPISLLFSVLSFIEVRYIIIRATTTRPSPCLFYFYRFISFKYSVLRRKRRAHYFELLFLTIQIISVTTPIPVIIINVIISTPYPIITFSFLNSLFISLYTWILRRKNKKRTLHVDFCQDTGGTRTHSMQHVTSFEFTVCMGFFLSCCPLFSL